MVNYHDPAKIAQDFWTVTKLWHTIDGLYIWEFFTTLDYEWCVIRGRRPYRWTIWVYSLTRVATLLAVILNMIGLDVTNPINCHVWVTFELIFAYTAFAAASLLIVIRTIAIWNRNKIIFFIAMSVWWTNVSFLIQGIVRLRSSWEPAQGTGTCAVLNTEISKANIVTTLCTDIILLVIMLVGLFRLRLQVSNPSSLGRLLWTQGIIWILLAAVAEVPAAVFICLNLNDPLNLMFQTPAMVTMSIAATRMYRSLIDFSSSDISQENSNSQSRIGSETKRISSGPVPLNGMGPMGVAIHTHTEQYPTSQASPYGLYIGADGRLCDKPRGLGIDDDVEGNREK